MSGFLQQQQQEKKTLKQDTITLASKETLTCYNKTMKVDENGHAMFHCHKNRCLVSSQQFTTLYIWPCFLILAHNLLYIKDMSDANMTK